MIYQVKQDTTLLLTKWVKYIFFHHEKAVYYTEKPVEKKATEVNSGNWYWRNFKVILQHDLSGKKGHNFTLDKVNVTI